MPSASARSEPLPSPEAGIGRRVGIWAADPITAAGLVALLPLVGFEAVVHADLDQVDALVVATDSEVDDDAETMTVAADAAGIPVLWLHRRHDATPLSVATARRVAFSRSDDVSVQEIGQALLGLLLDRPDGTADGAPGCQRVKAAPTTPQSEIAGRTADDSALLPIEQSVLRLLADGQDTAEIATALFYSERTVKNVISRAVRRLGAVNRSQAVAIAIRNGLL